MLLFKCIQLHFGPRVVFPPLIPGISNTTNCFPFLIYWAMASQKQFIYWTCTAKKDGKSTKHFQQPFLCYFVWTLTAASMVYAFYMLVSLHKRDSNCFFPNSFLCQDVNNEIAPITITTCVFKGYCMGNVANCLSGFQLYFGRQISV